MIARGDGTFSCERCGNRCHHQQSHCDSCREVQELRSALSAMLAREDDTRTIVSALDDQRIVDAARRTLEENPW